MAKKDVDVRIRAHDQATKAFRQSGRAAVGWGKTIRNVGGLVAGFVGFRALARLTTDSIRLFGEQREAEIKVRAALALLGDETGKQLPRMKQFASSIQDVTTMGDEAVLKIMALGAGLGKLSGEALEQATKAAIGLSEKLGIDTVAAMRLVARAAIGDTAMLKRYGVTLDATLTPQQKFNELLRQGEAAFSLATAQAKEGLGPLKQLKNSWGDLQEMIGGAVVESDAFRGGVDLLKKSVAALQKEVTPIAPQGGRAAKIPGGFKDISAWKAFWLEGEEKFIKERFAVGPTSERELAYQRRLREPGIEKAPSPLAGLRRPGDLGIAGRARMERGREAFAGLEDLFAPPVKERKSFEAANKDNLAELEKQTKLLEKLVRAQPFNFVGRSF